MTRRVSRCFLAAFLAGFPTSVLPAQEGQADSRPADSRPADAAKEQGPIRVAIIGASVSGGFVDITDIRVRPPNSSFTLKEVLRELWPSTEVRIRVATGGLAPLFAEGTDVIEHLDQELTLRGLAEVHRRSTGG